MARPVKCRKVCCLPPSDTFSPLGDTASADEIIEMTVEEYESVRLIDYEHYTQEECSLYMAVARTTVQSIYNDARSKIARALVEGKTLRIRGGNYRLCDGEETHCMRSGCRRCRCQTADHSDPVKSDRTDEERKAHHMKLCIPVDEKNLDSDVCISFGRTPFFLFYDTETEEEFYFDNSAISAQGGAGVKASQMIIDQGAAALLTLRCGENAADALTEAGISIYKTAFKTARENIKAFQSEQLYPLTDIHPGFHGQG